MEESSLVCLSKAKFNHLDPKMRKFAQLARSNEPYFHIIHKFSIFQTGSSRSTYVISHPIGAWILLTPHEAIAYLCDWCLL